MRSTETKEKHATRKSERDKHPAERENNKRRIRMLQDALSEKELYIEQLESRFREQFFRLQRIKKELADKRTYLLEIQASFGWRLLEYFRLSVRNRFFPQGTRRRNVYERSIGVIKRLVHVKRKSVLEEPYHGAQSDSRIKRETFVIPIVSGSSVQEIDTSVSVVIPTRNAGHDFHHVLNNIRRQKGIRDIEIIIIDSGSRDDTLSLAERYGAKLFTIAPSEFRHGRTRNYGAQQASGEFIIFLSQDAIPIGDNCFSDMIRGMIADPLIAAVSAKQVPRTDADLYACWELWNHYERFLRFAGDKVISIDCKEFDLLDSAEKRRIAQVDNVFSCIRNDVFKQFQLSDAAYAEDLDLGIRLIKKGYKIGFLSSVGAIHSHNRNPLYYFRRSYVDRKALISMLGYKPMDWHGLGIDSLGQMVRYIQKCYDTIEDAVSCFERNTHESGNVYFQLDKLFDPAPAYTARPHDIQTDKGFRLAIDELVRDFSNPEIIISTSEHVVIDQFLSSIDGFKESLSFYGDVSERIEEVISALYKLCAVVLGSNLGDYVASHESRKGDEFFVQLNRIFEKGV